MSPHYLQRGFRVNITAYIMTVGEDVACIVTVCEHIVCIVTVGELVAYIVTVYAYSQPMHIHTRGFTL